MDDLFAEFEPTPIGAASIAQAHLAVLKDNDGEPVVVKVQYPEVAALFDVDFHNLRLAFQLTDPDNLEFLETVRRTHENELDFRQEAQHLKEVQSNLQSHGVEPDLVRIPYVRNETGICGRNILVLEYLPGTSLKKVIDEEQARMARALGLTFDELRQKLGQQLEGVGINANDSNNLLKDGSVQPSEPAFNPRRAKLLQTVGPVAAAVLRVVGGAREWFASKTDDDISNYNQKARRHRKVNVGRALKTLVHVQGLQLLRDGVMNMDPHPGNGACSFFQSFFFAIYIYT